MQKRIFRNWDIVNVKIRSLCGKHERIIEAYSVPVICAPISNQTIKLALDKYPELFQIQLADYQIHNSEKDIDILIGANHYWNFTAGNTVRIDREFVALDTILGWILSGSFKPDMKHVSCNLISAHVLKLSCETKTNTDLDTTSLERFWEIESTGMGAKTGSFDCAAFLKRIKWNGERYSVPLPWKPDYEIIPDNFSNSLSRLNSSISRLKKDPSLLQEYDKIIKNQEAEKIIERLPKNSEVVAPGGVHYIPHHAVLRKKRETSKVRIVYHASSNNPSLNDCLEKGPYLLYT